MTPRGQPAEEGFVTLELVLGLVVLILPIMLLVLTLPTWFARQNIARLAAQEAARTAVLDSSLGQGTSAAQQIGANYGLASGDMAVSFAPSSGLQPGDSVTSQVTVRMPAVTIPGLGSVGGFSWTAVFSEQVDLYRSAP
ncbi:MAG TPA: hypothetical protein VFW71_10655 [Actinomycetota bacterium]|nr:hypothetical protein [Actinomycetota bacterium]